MATTTTNYGFDIPQSTDLVKDGATAIATLGQDIDTAMNTALGTKKAGMVLLNTTSFSGVASQSFNNVFSATYQNYKMVLNISASSGSDLTVKLRASGTDASTNYNRYGIAINSAGATTNYGSATAGGFFYLAQQSSIDTGCEFNLYSPFESTPTKFHAISSGGTSPVFIGGRHTTSSSYDGFSLLPDSGTITGIMRIYGFNN